MARGGNQDQINRETDPHVIRVASECSFSMEQRFKQPPIVLKPSASNFSCCIFRAPQSLVQINEKVYEPQIVSIGPYHHGRERLNMVEQHKPRFFSALLERTKDGGVGLNDYFKAVASIENKIRDCYSELLVCKSSALVEMMVLDACFIVEVFRVYGSVIQRDPDDPFFAMPWIFSFLIRDLLRIENQIPFFVLQLVFDLSKGDTADKAATCSLSELALNFFNMAAQRPLKQLEKSYGVSDVKHLLDLFRLSFTGHLALDQTERVDYRYFQEIPSAVQLLFSGIKFMRGDGNTSDFLNIQFSEGVLHIPPLVLDDFMSAVLLNCVAFEQCFSYCSNHITSYIVFMTFLVKTETDVELLSQKQVLVNYFGSNAEVAAFFNDLGKDITFDPASSYLAELFGEVNRYQLNGCKASVLLLVTVLQSFYAVYAYYRPPHPSTN